MLSTIVWVLWVCPVSTSIPWDLLLAGNSSYSTDWSWNLFDFSTNWPQNLMPVFFLANTNNLSTNFATWVFSATVFNRLIWLYSLSNIVNWIIALHSCQRSTRILPFGIHFTLRFLGRSLHQCILELLVALSNLRRFDYLGQIWSQLICRVSSTKFVKVLNLSWLVVLRSRKCLLQTL
jgi:hypothetical protein